jgi:CheY-like chemotaxis protein
MATDNQPRDQPESDATPVSMPATVLLIEDNAIVALDTEEILRSFGVSVVFAAGSAAQALAIIANQQPALAVLNVNLGVDNGFTVADALARANIPFVFATGYIDNVVFPARFADAPVIRKPYTAAILRAALAEIMLRTSSSNSSGSA